MKRKLKFVFISMLACCLFVFTGGCSGCTGEDEQGVHYFKNARGEYIVSSYDGFGEVNIPSTFNGKAVKYISRNAFKFSDITAVTIPESIISIGEGVFSGCNNLESISVSVGNARYRSSGNCLIEIESKTLIAGCKNSVIPDDGSVMAIGKYAFNYIELTNIVIPDSVNSIGIKAFYECNNLAEIKYTGGISDWCKISGLNDLMRAGTDDKKLYIDNREIAGKLVIPDGVTAIGDYAFYCCGDLTNVTIPDSVTSIGGSALSYCSGLTNVTIPDGVTSIGGNAFSGCSGLTNITIPDSVTSIGSFAFHGCSSLQLNEYDNAQYLGNDNNKYLVLITAKGADITSCNVNIATRFIHGSAFRNCKALREVYIPDGVTDIGIFAFYDCTALKTINFDGTMEKWEAISPAQLLITNCNVICSDGKIFIE